MRKVFLVLALVLSIFPSLNIASAAGCPSGIWSNLYPGECILEYSDEARTISGTNLQIQPDLLSCDDTFAGIKISTGYDRLSYVRLKNVPVTGEMKKNQVVNLELSMSENCRAWAKSYVATGQLLFQDGMKVPINLTETNFRYREKFTGSYDSYCYINICGTATLTGTFQIPSSAEGAAILSLTISYNSASATISQFSPISAQYKYSGTLFVGTPTPAPSATPSATPAPSPTPTATPTPTPTLARKSQTITAVTPQSIRVNARIYPLTAFVTSYLPMTITLNTPAVCNFSDGNFTLLSPGTCKSTLNQAGDSTWEPAPPVEIIFEVLPAPAVAVVKTTTITCIKGKLTKKVSGVKPVCPTGYKVKK